MGAAQKLDPNFITQKIGELPTLPTIVHELSQVISDPMSSTSDVESIMEKDQGLTTKVLKLVNSAYYAIPGGVSNLGRAVAYLGYDTIHQLVLSTSILETLKLGETAPFDVKEFWKHSLGVAIASENIAEHIRHPIPSDLFSCGLVHDMGKVVLCLVAPDLLDDIVVTAKIENLSFIQSERKLQSIPHTHVGAMLANSWNLPMQMQAAIKWHHEVDPKLRSGLSSELNRTVDIVFLGNIFAHALHFGHSGHDVVLGAPKELLQRLTIRPGEDFVNLLKKIKASQEKAADFIRIIEGDG